MGLPRIHKTHTGPALRPLHKANNICQVEIRMWVSWLCSPPLWFIHNFKIVLRYLPIALLTYPPIFKHRGKKVALPSCSFKQNQVLIWAGLHWVTWQLLNQSLKPGWCEGCLSGPKCAPTPWATYGAIGLIKFS